MKKHLLICLLALCSFWSFSQDKAMLTKEETVNYLNKKLNEGIKHGNKTIDFLTASSISMNDCLIKYKATISSDLNDHPYKISNSSTYKEQHLTYSFNPMHIKEIKVYEADINGGSMGRLQVILNSKTGQLNYFYKSYQEHSRKYRGAYSSYEGGYPMLTEYYYTLDTGTDKTESRNTMTFFYLQSDSSNFNKIKKALEHLRDLCKAEDDPFGN